MKVRQYQDDDEPVLRGIFQQLAFDYELPRMSSFCVRHVLLDGVRMAILARPTVELYMLVDKDAGTPAQRLEGLKLLHESVRRELEAKGFEDGNMWLPPEIEKSFSRRLCRDFGWAKNLWPCYTRKVRQ